ncbi:exodeoxyribonuclease VII large subunit [Methanobrevibacter curvatus]|uniref:Exodeoxyribonuclease 7 large subunit n=1 Tax=Methanobrevibacter curvatus TaxID=49547 RepID=A0A166CJ07_9EURY|nr:exodeoxyribonuclease VII large subunit [Methanobrevibacter curvatus]KZX14563.1 exodeoxyribonuclease 7 large subunit [Methanobrevibacter curvatus]
MNKQKNIRMWNEKMTNDNILTVSHLTSYLKAKISSDRKLRNINLRGEISNYKKYPSGHHYFGLKDEKSYIPSVMFSYASSSLNFQPSNGMKVIVSGKVDIYEAHGRYQFIVSAMEEDGLGNLHLKYEELKKKLKQEGMFQKPKKIIPPFTKKIGVVTSPKGAVIRDIITTVKRRWSIAEIILFPSLVQGNNAKYEIIEKIKMAEKFDIDVLIVGRGGGSMEDLWAFNEEIVVRAISESNIPIISAIGHETDTTLSDFVSDLRAPTPTAAAEQAVPNIIEVENRLDTNKIRLKKSIMKTLEKYDLILKKIMEKHILKDPMMFYQAKTEKMGFLFDKLIQLIQAKIDKSQETKEKLFKNLNEYMEKEIKESKNQLMRLNEKIIILNPLETIHRGYSIIKKGDKIISTVKNLSINDELDIEVKDGIIKSQIKKINPKTK